MITYQINLICDNTKCFSIITSAPKEDSMQTDLIEEATKLGWSLILDIDGDIASALCPECRDKLANITK